MRLLLLLLLFGNSLIAQDHCPAMLSLERQGELHDAWLQERAKTVLPELLRREGIDMWLLLSREYNEDPVLKTMLPSKWMGARRTTMLVVYDPGPGKPVETLACARYDVGDVFKKAWDADTQPDQWARLAEIIRERNPQKIAINRSEHFGLADGISSYHYDKLRESLPAQYQERIVSGEKLAIGWLETRIPAEMVVYRQVMAVAHAIIQEAFSSRVITPSVTTTDEVVWFMRERANKLGLPVWFHPTVDVQRAEQGELYAFSGRPGSTVIQPGDLLHCDFGITYCGLNTDTQHNAYVLRTGETEAPRYLRAAFAKGKQAMDLLTAEFANGRTGNELLSATLAKGKAAGLRPTVYSHPIGYHGHGAGPTIGLWDQQGGVPVRGDYPLYANTAYSIELNTKVYLDAWKKDIRMMMEEDGFWSGERFVYFGGRQEELYLIGRPIFATPKRLFNDGRR
ncbi:MAG: M24 family metallopeptidase [Bacteroidota bacterium]